MPTPAQNLRSLYDNARRMGFALPDFNTFRTDMADEAKRRRAWNTMRQYGFDRDFDTFSADIGHPLAAPTAQQPQPTPTAPETPTAPTTPTSTSSPQTVGGRASLPDQPNEPQGVEPTPSAPQPPQAAPSSSLPQLPTFRLGLDAIADATADSANRRQALANPLNLSPDQQAQLNSAVKQKEAINAQLKLAYDERDRLSSLLDTRANALNEEYDKRPWYLRLGEYANPDKNHDTMGLERLEVDPQYQQYAAALRMNNALITTLEDAASGKTNDFWHSLGTEIANGYTFSFAGKSAMSDAIALQNASRHIDAINEKLSKGEKLSEEEQAAEAVIRNKAWDNQVQAQFGDQYGAWARAGKMSANSADFMFDFALMGGAPASVAKGVASGVSRLGAKALGDAATKGFGKYMLNVTGATLGSMVAGAQISNTVGVNRTVADAANRHMGQALVDDNGNYVFGHFEKDDNGDTVLVEGGDSPIDAFLSAERSAIAENGSEIIGEFLPGSAAILDAMRKIGLSNVASRLTAVGKKGWYRNYKKALEVSGFHGAPGEALEEYLGTGLDAIMGGDEWKNLADTRTHIDIWLGTLTMSAMLQAPQMIASGVEMEEYYRYRHKNKLADISAANSIGQEPWNAIRQSIDDAPNDQVADQVAKILNTNPQFDNTQRLSLLDYVSSLQRMRGYNLGRIAAHRDPEQDPAAPDAAPDAATPNSPNTPSSPNSPIGPAPSSPQAEDNPSPAPDPYQLGYTADTQGRRDIAISVANNIGDPDQRDKQWQGVTQRIADDAAEQALREQQQWQQTAAPDGNTRQPVTLKEQNPDGTPKQAFLFSGNVALLPDGSVDPAASDKSVVIIDPTTGQRSMIDPASPLGIAALGETEQKADFDQQVEQRRQLFIDEQTAAAKGILVPIPGQPITLPDGSSATVLAISQPVGPAPSSPQSTQGVADASPQPAPTTPTTPETPTAPTTPTSASPLSPTITVQTADGKQSSFSLDELQAAADQAALSDFYARNPSLSPQAPSSPTTPTSPQVEGAPAAFLPDTEFTFRDDDGSTRTAVVTTMGRFDGSSFVPDPDGNLVEFYVPGENRPRHLHRDRLAPTVLSHVPPTPQAETAPSSPQNAQPQPAPTTPETPTVPTTSISDEERVIREGISGVGEGFKEAFTPDATAAVREADINRWLQNPKVAAAFASYAKGKTSVEDVVAAALADNPSDEVRQALNDILRFNSSRSAIAALLPTTPTTPTTPTAPIAPAPSSPQEATAADEPMPMLPPDKDGDAEPDFLSTTPQRTHRYIYGPESNLPTEVADKLVENLAAEAQKALDKVKKTQPKIGTSAQKYNRALAQWQQSVDNAQRAVDFWAAVKDEQEKAMAPIRAEQEAKAKAEAEWRNQKAALDRRLHDTAEEVRDIPEALEVLQNMEPQTYDEIAAAILANGNVLWSDRYVSGSRVKINGKWRFGDRIGMGAATHVGIGEGERRKLFGLFRSAENGGKTIDELAEDTFEMFCHDAGIPYDNQQALDALIDMIRTSRTFGDIRNYIANRRIEQATEIAEAYREQELAAREQYAQEAFHLSYDEYVAREEVYAAEMQQAAKNFDIQEFNAILAEEYEQRLSQQQHDTTATTSNDTPAEGPGNGQGDSVLPGQQPVPAPRAGSAEEQPQPSPAAGVQGPGPSGDVPQSPSQPDQVEPTPSSPQQVGGRASLPDQPKGTEGVGETAPSPQPQAAPTTPETPTAPTTPTSAPSPQGVEADAQETASNSPNPSTPRRKRGGFKGGRRFASLNEEVDTRFAEEKAQFADKDPKQNGYAAVLQMSKSYAEAVRLLQARIKKLRADVEDWRSRVYKKNDTVVHGNLDNANEFSTTISAANERRRENTIRALEHEIQTVEEQINTLSERVGLSPLTNINDKDIEQTYAFLQSLPETNLRNEMLFKLDVRRKRLAELSKKSTEPTSSASTTPTTPSTPSSPSSPIETAPSSPQQETADNQPLSLADIDNSIDNGAGEQSQSSQSSQPHSKWVADEDAEEFDRLRKRLRDKLRGQLNMGVDPEILAIGSKMAYLVLKNGVRKIRDFAKTLIEAVGEEVRPCIKSFYSYVRYMPDVPEDWKRDMSSLAEVDAFDAYNFDKTGAKDIVATAQHIVKEKQTEQQAAVADQKLKDKRNKSRKKTSQPQSSQPSDLGLFDPAIQQQPSEPQTVGGRASLPDQPKGTKGVGEVASSSQQETADDKAPFFPDRAELEKPFDELIGEIIGKLGNRITEDKAEELAKAVVAKMKPKSFNEATGLVRDFLTYASYHGLSISPLAVMPAIDAAAEAAPRADAQGNPLNNDGTLRLLRIGSLNQLPDDFFINPLKSVQLPKLPEKVDAAIGAHGKPVVIKKSIFERNAKAHPDVTPSQSREILTAALYNPDVYGQTQPSRRSYNWVVINTKDESGHNRLVLLEVNENKDNIEIVHWHYIDQKGLDKLKRQAEREDGQLLILPSATAEEAGALSGRAQGEPSDRKVNESSPTTQPTSSQFRAAVDDVDATLAAVDDAKRLEAEIRSEPTSPQQKRRLHKAEKATKTAYEKYYDARLKVINAINETADPTVLKAIIDYLREMHSAYFRVMNDFAQTAEQRLEHLTKSAEAWDNAPDLPAPTKKARPFSLAEATNAADKEEAKLRPVFSGVFHDETAGMAVATNTRVMVASRKDYDQNLAGRIVAADGNSLVTDSIGKPISDYPQWERVAPDREKAVSVANADIPSLARAVDEALRSIPKKADRADAAVLLRFPDGTTVGVNIQFLATMLRGAAHIGATSIECHGQGRAIVARAADGSVALAMPYTQVYKASYRINFDPNALRLQKAARAATSSPQDAKPQPTSGFGPIYAQFKGKPKEAIAYLLAKKSGEAIGALHHEKLGDISIVWGDENGGLSHIVGKHVGEGKSFETIEKAADEIEGIINNGSIVFENGDKAVFKIGNKLVTVRKNYRENGKKIADKNWVLTAYDETLADGGNSAITATNQGKAAPAAKESDGKDSKSSPTGQKVETTNGNGKGGKAMGGVVQAQPIAPADAANGDADRYTSFEQLAADSGEETAQAVDGPAIRKLAERVLKLPSTKKFQSKFGYTEESNTVIAYASEKKLFEKYGKDFYLKQKPLTYVDRENGCIYCIIFHHAQYINHPNKINVYKTYLSAPSQENGNVVVEQPAPRLQKAAGAATSSPQEAKAQPAPAQRRPTASEPLTGYSAENANFVSSYETKDGKTVRYTSENPEAYGGLFDFDFSNDVPVDDNAVVGERVDRRQQSSTPLQRRNAALLDTNASDRLNEANGEYCALERKFRESNYMEFTSAEKVESADDVAFIFEELENASVENVFVVMTKRGVPTVMHISIGNFNSSIVNIAPVKLAYERIKPDKVYFVHNHPSGALNCSPQDVSSLKMIENAIGKKADGVIIDLNSGKYGTFDSSGTYSSASHDKAPAPAAQRRLRLYAFDRHVFNPNYQPSKAMHSAEDVAKFLSSHRLGDRSKVSVLVCNNQNQIVANVHTTHVSIDSKGLADDIIRALSEFGGMRAFLYGDFEQSDRVAYSDLAQAVKERSGNTYSILDVVRIEGNHTWSARSNGYVYEQSSEYKTQQGSDGIRKQKAQQVTGVSETENRLRDALVGVLRSAGINVSTDYAQGQRVLDEYNSRRETRKVREQRTYHGSGADFDAFDNSHMGEGEGHQSHGWGLYAVKEQGKASLYANGHLYEVEIPDDTGRNYLDYDREVDEAERRRIFNELYRLLAADEYKGSESELRRELNELVAISQSGGEIYGNVSAYLGGDKEASEFLHGLGYTGISYEDKGSHNYVIFNEKDAKITNHIRFFRTPDGTAYGFTLPDGSIYIDPRIATAETPIHEYTHLATALLRAHNPKEWRRIVDMLRDTPAWRQAEELYPELADDPDALADEAIALFSGQRGAKRLNDLMAEGLAADDAIEKARRIAPLQRIRQALRRLWQALRNLLGLSRWSSPEALADDLLSDLLNRVNPLARANAKQKVGGRASQPDQSRVANRTADPMELARRMDERNGTEVGRFVDFLRRGKLREGEDGYFHVANTGETLNRCGISGKITTSTTAVNSHHTRDNDHLDESDWVAAIDNINNPLAVTRYGKRKNSYRIYTIVVKNGKNICVGVDVNSVGRNVNITNIKTAFARDIEKALDEELLYPSREQLKTAIEKYSSWHNPRIYSQQPYDAAKVGNNSESSNNPDDFLPDDIRFRFSEQQELRDIVARAKADGSYMTAPNGQPSNLSPRQWAQVRSQAFKAWFGDWELPGKIVNIVHAAADHGFASFDNARQWARENIVRTLSNEETGGKGEIRISNAAVSKFLSQSSVEKSDSRDAHLCVLRSLPEVIRESIDAEQHPDYRKGEDGVRRPENGTNPDVTIHRLYGAVNIGGTTYRVRVTVKEDRTTNEPNKAYSYEATKIELLDAHSGEAAASPGNSSSPASGAGTLGRPEDHAPSTPARVISCAKLLNGVEKSYSPGQKLLDASKVLDENGEPLVVYHGTQQAGFSEFDNGGANRNGLYFIDNRGIASDYAANSRNSAAFPDFDADDVDGAMDFLRRIGVKAKLTKKGDTYTLRANGTEERFEYPEDVTDYIYNEFGTHRGIYDCFLTMRKPFVIDAQGSLWRDLTFTIDGKTYEHWTTDGIVKFLQQEYPDRYDGIVVRNVRDSKDGRFGPAATDYIAFDPAQIKSATDNVGSFDPANPDIRFQMSRKVRDQVASWLAKRDDLSDDDRAAILDYIDNEVEGRKEQLAAGWWAAKGTVRLPEDIDKVRQAVAVAERKHADIFRYSSPMELIDALGDIKAKDKPIDPETVPTLHRNRELPGGIVIYDVDDTEQSRQAMRQIINTHFGKDCSPWCLLQGDEDGNLTEQSAQYWRHYNSYPKQVAFKDGKLVAFSANDSRRRVWWDRQDESHDGIPVVGKIPGDPLGRSGCTVYDPKSGESQGVNGKMWKGNKDNGRYTEWNEQGKLFTEQDLKADGSGWIRHYYSNGRTMGETSYGPQGSMRGWQRHWDKDGSLNYANFYDDSSTQIYAYSLSFNSVNEKFYDSDSGIRLFRDSNESCRTETIKSRESELYSSRSYDGEAPTIHARDTDNFASVSIIRDRQGIDLAMHMRLGRYQIDLAFYDDGKMKGLSETWNGTSNGRSFKFNTDGSLAEEVYHIDGQQVSRSTYETASGTSGDPRIQFAHETGKIKQEARRIRAELGERFERHERLDPHSASEVSAIPTLFRTADHDTFADRRDRAVAEKGSVAPGLASAEVDIVTGKGCPFNVDKPTVELRKDVLAYAQDNGIVRTLSDVETGGKGPIRISAASVKKFVDDSSIAKSDDRKTHLSVLPVLHELIHTSVLAETHPDYRKGDDGKRSPLNGLNQDVLIHRLYGALDIDGKLHRVKITLKEEGRADTEPQKAYSYEITKIELLPGQNEEASVNPRASSRYGSNSITAAKLLQDVEKSYDHGKKLLDESADPSPDEPTLFRPVEDPDLIARLEAAPTMKVYRAMQVIDGELYPPMSANDAQGRRRTPSRLGVWEQSEEDPEHATPDGKYKLDKGNGKSLEAAYNPYLHSSTSMLNDQFAEAQGRDNLVVVEMEVPISELSSGYHAEKALDSVGLKQWKAGPVQGAMSGTREVMLSRWAKPVRIVPTEEAADRIAEQLKTGGVETMPSNVVTPQQRQALEQRGIRFIETDNNGKIVDGPDAGLTWASVYGGKADEPKAVNARFNAHLDRYADRTLPSGHRFNLGMPSRYLLGAGFPNLPITMRASLLARKAGDVSHPFDPNDLQDLPNALRKPIAVFRYSSENTRNVIVELTHGDKHFLVGVTLDYQGGELRVNSVSGLFPKDSHEWIKWIQDGKAIRIDQKQKVQDLIDSLRTNPAESARIGLNLNDTAKLVKDFKNPKLPASPTAPNPPAEPADPRSTALALADRLNTKVTVYDDPGQITHPDPDEQARRRASKGWFDPATGEVAVVLPNNRDAADVAATVAHETVAHKGLPELVGKERFNQFLDEVYSHLNDELKAQVDRAAARLFLNSSLPTAERVGEAAPSSPSSPSSPTTPITPTSPQTAANPSLSYEAARRIAVNELFGRLAEKPFDEFNATERTLWQRIKAAVRRLLDEFLADLHLPSWFTLGDHELRYILFRSKQRLEKVGTRHAASDPVGGRASLPDHTKDTQGVGAASSPQEAPAPLRMGDSPASFPIRQKRTAESNGTVMPGLRQASVKVVDGIPRHHYSGGIEEATHQAIAAAKAKYAPDGKPKTLLYDNHGAKFAYTISNGAIVSTLSPKHQAASVNKGVHLALAEHIDRVIADSIEVEEHPDRLKSNGIRDNASINPDALMHRFYGVARIDGIDYRVMTLLREDRRTSEPNGIHSYEVQKIEVLDELATSTPNGVDTPNSGLEAYPLAKLIQNVGKTMEPDKKILDVSPNSPLPQTLFRPSDETSDIWADPSLGMSERMTAAAARLAANHADDRNLRDNAIRQIGANLNELRQATAQQRAYDRSTAKRVADLARILIANRLIPDLQASDAMRLLSAVKNATGREDISKQIDKVLDIMVDCQLRSAEKSLDALTDINDTRTDSRGVQVMGQLDPAGQTILAAFRKARKWERADIEQAIADEQARLSSSDQSVANEAANLLAGLQLALDYSYSVKESKKDEADLRRDLKDPAITPDQRDALLDAIRKCRTDRAQAYLDIARSLADALSGSVAAAAQFRADQAQRVNDIHHDANSDMKGRPAGAHIPAPSLLARAANHPFAQFFTKPLATFEQMLRLMAPHSADGEGYLYNRFARGWVDARQAEIAGMRSRYKTLDEMAAKVLGKPKAKWADLMHYAARLPKLTVEFFNDGEMQQFELPQGNLMYIYMVNKMADGRMKLRRMGISQDTVDDIVTNHLDPKLRALADWIQDVFLVDTRNTYNATHQRVFGANMAAIEDYFPLRILANGRTDTAESLDNPDALAGGISTKTGAIIRRRRNSLPLDLLNADALHVLLDHVAEMEHWNAFVELKRDLNTLRTYSRFRNQVQNMTTVYGSGKVLWKKFNDLCQLATGTYRPPIAELDQYAVNIAKGVTAAKVSFRLFTALKQFLSMPAYLPDARPDYLLADIANPAKAWRWAMDNLPIFNERWHSRIAGDPRLQKSDLDWKMWRRNLMQLAQRVGMTPNAFVDALTVSIGAHSMFRSRLARYVKEGFPTDVATRRATQDTEILYNQTQQSSEGMFLSTMQVDRSWLSVLFTVFRNASMAYQRQLHDALRNIARNSSPSKRKDTLEYLAKQYVRQGIAPDKAKADAADKLSRSMRRDALRVLTFGCLMQLAWNLGGYLPYLLFGGDDDDKDSMLRDIAAHTAFGWVEGLTSGDVASLAGSMMFSDEANADHLDKDMPLTSDIAMVLRRFSSGHQKEAMTDIVNLLVQSGIGANPQSLTDAALAIMDACGNDPALANEALLCALRILQVPQSQSDKLFFDEVNIPADQASKYTPQQLAERYALYKVKRGYAITPWLWDDPDRIASKQALAKSEIRQRALSSADADVNKDYQRLEEQYKKVAADVAKARKTVKTDYIAGAKMMAQLQADKPSWQLYSDFKALDKNLDRYASLYLAADTPDKADICRHALAEYRTAMVDYLNAASPEQRKTAAAALAKVANDFSSAYQAL